MDLFLPLRRPLPFLVWMSGVALSLGFDQYTLVTENEDIPKLYLYCLPSNLEEDGVLWEEVAAGETKQLTFGAGEESRFTCFAFRFEYDVRGAVAVATAVEYQTMDLFDVAKVKTHCEDSICRWRFRKGGILPFPPGKNEELRELLWKTTKLLT